MNKIKVNLTNNLILKSKNIEYKDGTLKDCLDNIIDSGSNSNGEYLKFANGIMIQFQRYSIDVAITTQWGSWYYGTQACPNFPQSFVGEMPTITATIYPTSSSWCLGNLVYGTGKPQSLTSAGTIMCVKPDRGNSVPVVAEIISIGRWK